MFKTFGRIAIAAGIAIALGTVATPPASAVGPDRSMIVVNTSTTAEIEHIFYVRNDDPAKWTKKEHFVDHLGDVSILPATKVRFKVHDGSTGQGSCMYDLWAVFTDGKEATVERGNVCTADVWNVKAH
ncbi:MAG TPA: hypothetical protein VN495_02475 [Candidatus Paceibacterota bacterium]|nr:hypothetical protein [Candidatus Paceibacterota bacterium]